MTTVYNSVVQLSFCMYHSSTFFRIPLTKWVVIMKYAISCMVALLISLSGVADARLPSEFDTNDPLYKIGCLDVTKAPYLADPTGTSDATEAIQRAVDDARDNGLCCFLPEGTYLISDTISCQQQVAKLDRPRFTDNGTQHYWDKSHRIVMIGSTKGKRPVLKLSPNAQGFADPAKPKMAVWVWAQTRNDAPGKEEPIWGKEQPNISFGHIFKGIDIDIRGHAGAIGIRHSGSQGSTLQDSTILAEGACSGMSNCCGQGGGTYNIEVIGGRYGISIDRESRFPLLGACAFRGQTEASVRFVAPSQMPSLFVGCCFEPSGDTAIDLSRFAPHAGITMVDCIVDMNPGGTICRTAGRENIFMENTFVRGAATVFSGGRKTFDTEKWIHIDRYSAGTPGSVQLINGTVEPADEFVAWEPVPAPPAFESISARHYARSPSFEDPGVVNVKSFGARGDGTTDDTEAFRKAIAASDKVFVPKGQYMLSGRLELGPDTCLFGISHSHVGIGHLSQPKPITAAAEAFSIVTVDSADASPGLYFMRIGGGIDWRSGKGDCMLARGYLKISGNGGGRFYGTMAMGRPLILDGIRRPTGFYAMNVERITTNPQSQIRNCSHVRIYFFKVEAGTLNRADAGDGNTPCRISNSDDIRVYCMQGVVRKLGERPMIDVVNSKDVIVAQLKTFSPADFPHLTETIGETTKSVPSSKPCALFIRD